MGETSNARETPRTRLRCWREADREALAAMHADTEVMRDYGGPISRAASDAKLERYVAAFDRFGFCRWAVESREGEFLGYAGVMPSSASHPLGFHFEIGWRLVRRRLGPRLRDVVERAGLSEVLAHTSPDNFRSQAVMERLRLQRDASRDFTGGYDGAPGWRGWVWVARSPRRLSAAV